MAASVGPTIFRAIRAWVVYIVVKLALVVAVVAAESVSHTLMWGLVVVYAGFTFFWLFKAILPAMLDLQTRWITWLMGR